MKRILVVRVLDDATIFEMDSTLAFEDALEIATDIVYNAADWYDSGDSPWRVKIVDEKP